MPSGRSGRRSGQHRRSRGERGGSRRKRGGLQETVDETAPVTSADPLLGSMQQALTVRQALQAHAAKQSALMGSESVSSSTGERKRREARRVARRKRRFLHSSRHAPAKRSALRESGSSSSASSSSGTSSSGTSSSGSSSSGKKKKKKNKRKHKRKQKRKLGAVQDEPSKHGGLRDSHSGEGSSKGSDNPDASDAKVPPTPTLQALVDAYNQLEKEFVAEKRRVDEYRAWVGTTLKPGLAQMNSRLTARTEQLKEDFVKDLAPFLARARKLTPQIHAVLPIFDELQPTVREDLDGCTRLRNAIRDALHSMLDQVEAMHGVLKEETARMEAVAEMVARCDLENAEERLMETLQTHVQSLHVGIADRLSTIIDAAFADEDVRIEQQVTREAVRQVDGFVEQLQKVRDAPKPNPLNPDRHSAATRQAEFFDWLASHGYERYFANFKEYGYDTIPVLVTLTPDEIGGLGIDKAGHRRGIEMAVEGLRRDLIAQEGGHGDDEAFGGGGSSVW